MKKDIDRSGASIEANWIGLRNKNLSVSDSLTLSPNRFNGRDAVGRVRYFDEQHDMIVPDRVHTPSIRIDLGRADSCVRVRVQYVEMAVPAVHRNLCSSHQRNLRTLSSFRGPP
jgi:hypothetical protein